MNFYKLPIIPIVIALVIGILLNTYISIDYYQLFWLIFCSILSLSILHYYNIKTKRKSIYHTILVYLSFCSIGILLSKNNYDLSDNDHFSKHQNINQIKGIFTEKLRASKHFNKFYGEIVRSNQKKCSGRLIIYISKKVSKNIEVGNQFIINKTPEYLISNGNPFQFDFVNYLNKQNIFHSIKIIDNKEIIVEKDTNLFSFINKVRNKISALFDNDNIKLENANLLRGLLLGERTVLDKELNETYANAGIIHILAISGMHIVLLYSGINSLFGFLKRKKNGQAILFYLSLTLLWFYAFFTGFSASVVRAAVWITIVNINKFSGRQFNIYNALGLSILCILICDSNYLFDAGFQLSFMATLSIIACQDMISKHSYSEYKPIVQFKSMFLVTLVAQIGVLPLSLYYFGKFPILFMFSNILAIFLSDWLVKIGVFFILLNFIPFLSKVLAVILNFGIEILNQIAHFFGDQSYFMIEEISFHLLLVISGYWVIFQLFMYLKSNLKQKKLVFLLSSILFFQIAYLFIIIYYKTSSEFLIANSFKNQLIIEKNKDKIVFYGTDWKSIKKDALDYISSNFSDKFEFKTITNFLYYKGKIAIIDSDYKPSKADVDYLILSKSPKTNIERIIKMYNPKVIIADGSNYKSVVKLWKQTCQKLQIPFHSTAEKGYYKIE